MAQSEFSSGSLEVFVCVCVCVCVPKAAIVVNSVLNYCTVGILLHEIC